MLFRVIQLNNDHIPFSAALVYARKIDVSPKVVTAFNVHRGRMAKLDTGFLIIEQQWFPKK